MDLVSHEFNADNSRVKLVTKRRLDTGETSEDYLIPLNQEIDMVWAWKSDSGEWAYHNQYGRWKVTFDETLGNPVAEDSVIGGAIGAIITGNTPLDQLPCYKKTWDVF